ncbi:hypothetical protein GA0116948_101425 [Chitinophaga costaii]|uniref:Long-chain fatty acid transport protein n=1 Tax=Chitinophaga costaii TaxID=1335309 RepID=A0A1C3ZJR6_9BACT|nr:hypothetical protein [Chitinophaga costaii]PUZ30400.1 hypothetical protein DCM91_02690 [Chitinophaga costaii]SCB82460.1 hypothetical protein GA0116948_101425 [Chitinophaga costaii]
MNIKKIISVSAGSVLLLFSKQAIAQHGQNSLYSAFAIGDLDEHDYSRNFGLGSAGMARKSVGFLNELNPASYSGIPTQNFILEGALNFKLVGYKGNEINQTGGDFAFRRVALGFNIMPGRWGASIGFQPYSSIDYKLLETKYITGTSTPLNASVEGSGGLNRVYFSNGVRVTKNLSLGLSSAFLFGPINSKETFEDNITNGSIYTQRSAYGFNANFTLGAQYHAPLAGKWALDLGATYRFKTSLHMKPKININNSSDESLFEDDLANTNFNLPEAYGGGFSLTNNRLTIVGDYRHEAWDGLNKPTTYQLKNSDRIAGGIEYSLSKAYYNGQLEGKLLQLGASHNKSYLNIDGKSIMDNAVTVGISIPQGYVLRYSLGLEIGRRGTMSSGLVQETYVNAVFHLTFRDIWFVKRKEY